MIVEEYLTHPHFTCLFCGADNVLEVDAGEGFPQSFVWDCERCCHAHEIEIRREADEIFVLTTAV